ncbi:MBL-fold metallo-hydrolase superfamily [hydrothermal vent metagenome]|uniref:MBL-fold metallo-hydrolase superfamily n=1 Tax=hydrothermal vent metagenome TaxID=652676 RepID=A0A3B0YLJ3_9ZZZZ
MYDSLSKGIFTGDSFGLSYREFDTSKGPFILPTTSPVQFDPKKYHDSIQKLLDLDPRYLYLTHFGKVDKPQKLALVLHRQIDLFVEQVKAVSRFQKESQCAALVEQLQKLLIAQIYEHGCQMPETKVKELLEMDVQLNAQGLLCWLGKTKNAE